MCRLHHASLYVADCCQDDHATVAFSGWSTSGLNEKMVRGCTEFGIRDKTCRIDIIISDRTIIKIVSSEEPSCMFETSHLRTAESIRPFDEIYFQRSLLLATFHTFSTAT